VQTPELPRGLEALRREKACKRWTRHGAAREKALKKCKGEKEKIIIIIIKA